MKRNLFFILLFMSVISKGQSPGGIKNASVWIKDGLDNGNTNPPDRNPGPVVSSLQKKGWINFNPAMNFDDPNESSISHKLSNNFPQATIFTIYQENNPGIELPVWTMSDAYGSAQLTTHYVKTSGEIIPFARGQVTGAIINTYIRYAGNDKIENEDQAGLLIGAAKNGETSFRGKVAEVILYNRVLKLSEQYKIESYLAVKYGISLKHDYLSSSGSVIWSFRKNPDYSNHIIGIGQDNKTALFQKQSMYSDDSLTLIIAAGRIANSNDENLSVIEDHNFLLSGDNNGSLITENMMSPKKEEMAVIKRNWLMNSAGKSAAGISTELAIDISKILPTIFPANKYVLLIDRSGKGDFTGATTEVFNANELSSGGILRFRNIYWDTDQSGKDIFTFGLKSETIAVVNTSAASNEKVLLYPNPSTGGFYNVDIQLEKPATIKVDIFDAGGHLVQTLSRGNQTNYHISGRIQTGAGIYTFVIQTGSEKISRELIIQ